MDISIYFLKWFSKYTIKETDIMWCPEVIDLLKDEY